MRRLKDPNTTLGPQLRLAREAAKLTQQELAEAAGMDQGEISRMERGLVMPTVATLQKLADALHVSFGYDGSRIVFGQC